MAAVLLESDGQKTQQSKGRIDPFDVSKFKGQFNAEAVERLFELRSGVACW